MSKRTELLRKIRDILKRNGDKTLREIIRAINPVIGGWVSYFRIGNSTSTFGYIRNNISYKLMLFARKRKEGLGRKKWSKEILYSMGLFNNYHIEYYKKATFCP